LCALDNAPAIVIISHDTEVIAECDVVYALEQGRLVRRGLSMEDATENGREPAGVHPSYAAGERIGS
jgi:ABC-type bacteriocin/lantibiotic exporter with double-glycine peptidase domain